MIRLFKVYYPLRTLVLLVGEAMIVWLSFLLATLWRNHDSLLLLNVDGGYLQVLSDLGPRVLVVTMAVLLLSHWFDLYDVSRLSEKWEHAFRLLLVLGFVALALALVATRYPSVLPGNGAAFWGLIILTFLLFCWRSVCSWIVQRPFLRERVYVLGTGERAERLVTGLRKRAALGVEVVGWTGDVEGELTRDSVASHLLGLAQRKNGVHRVIVAMPDRRGTLPVAELLNLRLAGVKRRRSNFVAGKNHGKNRSRAALSQLAHLRRRLSVQHSVPVSPQSSEFSGRIDGARAFSALTSLHCASRKVGFCRPCALSAAACRAGWKDFLLLQIPHHAS